MRTPMEEAIERPTDTYFSLNNEINALGKTTVIIGNSYASFVPFDNTPDPVYVSCAPAMMETLGAASPVVRTQPEKILLDIIDSSMLPYAKLLLDTCLGTSATTTNSAAVQGGMEQNDIDALITAAAVSGAFKPIYFVEPVPNFDQDAKRLKKEIIDEADGDHGIFDKLLHIGRTILSVTPNALAIKSIWQLAGVDGYLAHKGWKLSGDLLEKSLNKYRVIEYDSYSYAAKLIKNSDQFRALVGDVIDKAHVVNYTFSERTSGKFERDGTTTHADLFAALHRYRAVIGGTWKGGSWHIVALLGDVYDFTEMLTLKNGISFINIANDAANICQRLGIISPMAVLIKVEFEYSVLIA